MSEEPRHAGWPPRDATASHPRSTEPDTTEPTPGGTPATPPRRTGLRRLRPTRRTVLTALLIAAVLLVGGFVAGYTLVGIPPANAAAVAQSNLYLYEDGSPLARDGEVNRENVRLTQVPLTVRHAVLAAEDRDFYSERAVDPQGMVRAAWNTLTGKGKQSGSTITQQYVKNYYLGQEQTIKRKWKEFFISVKLSREQSKDDILLGYLNTSYYGRNAYGIQAAAQAYYGKDVEDLDTAEGAYLASVLNAPSAFDVSLHPENTDAAVARWNYTLDGMVGQGWLTPTRRAALTFRPPRPARPATGLSGQRGYVVQAVEEYLTGRGILDEKTLATGGYRITTTLQRTRQDALARAVDDQVTSRLDPTRAADRNVRVGGVSIDPATGRVVALYGGVDYTRQYVNNATRRDYQVGSTFKPFVLAAAVEHGSRTQDGRLITPGTLYDGTDRRTVQGWGGKRYAPGNEDGISHGYLTVAEATDRSVNAVYAQMAMDVGPANVRRTAIDLGLPAGTPDLTASPSIALGPATASVLDMAEAYATLADHGRHGAYTLVAKVTKDGTAVRLPERRVRQAIDREAADTTTAVLQNVVAAGTGTAARSAGRPAAGKTGTAEEDRAAWFAGYTPELATVVAIMGQDPDSGAQRSLYGALGLPRVSGGGAPARIWGQYTGAALAGTEITEFDLWVRQGAWQVRPAPGTNTPGTGPATAPGTRPAPGGPPGNAPPGTAPGSGTGGVAGAQGTAGATGGPGTGAASGGPAGTGLLPGSPAGGMGGPAPGSGLDRLDSFDGFDGPAVPGAAGGPGMTGGSGLSGVSGAPAGPGGGNGGGSGGFPPGGTGPGGGSGPPAPGGRPGGR
ncbi:transglycosylase domain-containing protein [Streptomyces yaizuensis]|uniref:Penicillin-binding protein n=1 Tax=Streptomyces yaizuensis TaxID=2989713 RepID=A0ABQ5NT13_9ACTN|nr:transglycosylase domain-containing protein [Streptomyces sp. YSPA8]GLF93507.1 penicillin-binding protein [Streptomyces sp. YSPA8]